MITSEQLEQANKQLTTLSIKGKEYVQVTERVKAFRSICPNGSITTEIISMDGEKVVMKSTVCDGDTVLGTGLAYERESSSYINKTSYIENCETSAVGRALGFCGIGIDGSMCSAEELVNAITQQKQIEAQEARTKKGRNKVSAEEAAEIRGMCETCGVNIEKLLLMYKVNSFEEMTPDHYAILKSQLESRINGNNSKN